MRLGSFVIFKNYEPNILLRKPIAFFVFSGGESSAQDFHMNKQSIWHTFQLTCSFCEPIALTSTSDGGPLGAVTSKKKLKAVKFKLPYNPAVVLSVCSD